MAELTKSARHAVLNVVTRNHPDPETVDYIPSLCPVLHLSGC